MGSVTELSSKLKGAVAAKGLRTTNSTLNLRISDQVSFQANVNAEKDGVYMGEILSQGKADYAISMDDGNQLSGHIILHDSKKAYKLSSDASGNALATLVDINAVLCVEYDHMEAPIEKTAPQQKMAAVAAANNLQSLPGAPGCIYMDFDGEYSVSRWNGGNPINAAPSGMSDAAIQEVWEIVSEDYRPFRVNVTTSLAVFNTYPRNRRMRCIVTPTKTAAPSAGVLLILVLLRGMTIHLVGYLC
jgi:hypothetical protein